jgi:hypothetical protein
MGVEKYVGMYLFENKVQLILSHLYSFWLTLSYGHITLNPNRTSIPVAQHVIAHPY